jgi:hypothetical protein
MREYTLKVGQTVPLRKSFFGKTYQIIFAGMPNDSTYTLVITMTYGYNMMAYNLFFRTDQKDIDLKYGRLRVSRVTSREITFVFEKEI